MGWMGFIERRIRFYNAIKKNENNILLQAGSRFTFSDFGIEYEDQERSYKLSWPLFYPCVIFKEHLLLIQKGAKSATFIFSKKGLEENNEEVNYLLKEKLGLDPGKS